MLRWTAAAALGRARARRQDVREHLELLLLDPDFRLRWQAADALGRLGRRDALSALGARRAVEQDSRVTRALREAIGRLSAKGGPKKEIAGLSDEIEGLKALVGKLQDRLDRQADNDG